MNTVQYYVRVRKRTLGPFGLDAVQQMVRKAQIGRATEISTDGIVWGPASGFPEIFDRSAAVLAQPTIEVGPPIDPLGFDNLLGGGSAAASTPGPRSLMWHYTMKGQQQANPTEQQALINLIVAGHVGPDDNVWNETMGNWARVADVPALAGYAIPAVVPWPVQTQGEQSSDDIQRTIHGEPAPDFDGFVAKRVPAGVIALFLGNLGIHKFMLGLTGGGITMLILFFLIIPIPVLAVISLIEGILYLTKSEKQFYKDYAIHKKQWF